MSANDYHFITTWRVKATPQEITDVIADARELPRWWPSVYLAVNILNPGDARGVGSVIDLYTKGWLPYTLRWRFTVTESRAPYGLTLAADGDFVGRGIWTFEADGEWVNVTYDWQIRAEKPLLRRLSFLMKPIFGANHRWAMRQGETSLKLELERRRAPTPEARMQIAPPPPPTPNSPLKFAGMLLRGSR